MSDIADRYRRVAGAFSDRVRAVPPDRWDAPAPCEGWVARDIVAHLVEWLSAYFFGTWGIEPPPAPSVEEDPAGAWFALDRTIQAALDDPAVAGREAVTRFGPAPFESQIDMICTGDILIHTWDLARAAGLDERLDDDEVRAFLAAAEPMDEALRQSGHYGPKVPVPDDADEQTRLLAFLGRQP
jgi:uncharacterized protein (TIGR03086 family)